MEAKDQIPNSWNVSNTEEVTVDPVLDEEGIQLSSSGAGPQYKEVRGTIITKPCSVCGQAMSVDRVNMVLTCPQGHNETARLSENEHAQDL